MTDVAGLGISSIRVRARAHKNFIGKRVASVTWMTTEMTTTILTLDLGTTTGWALHQHDGTITSGTQCFAGSRYEGGGMRFLRFKRWLSELLACTPALNAVFYEEVRNHRGVDAAHVYGGLLAHLTAWCEARNLPYQGVPVGTIKAHATGKGNAGKEAVMAAMRAKGHDPKDDNEADALALLHWALAQEVVA